MKIPILALNYQTKLIQVLNPEVPLGRFNRVLILVKTCNASAPRTKRRQVTYTFITWELLVIRWHMKCETYMFLIGLEPLPQDLKCVLNTLSWLESPHCHRDPNDTLHTHTMGCSGVECKITA